MQEGAVTMKQHRDELNENDHREEDKKSDAERFEVLLFDSALLGHADVKRVLELVLHDLQEKDDEEPKEVEHEEEKGGVVA